MDRKVESITPIEPVILRRVNRLHPKDGRDNQQKKKWHDVFREAMGEDTADSDRGEEKSGSDEYNRGDERTPPVLPLRVSHKRAEDVETFRHFISTLPENSEALREAHLFKPDRTGQFLDSCG